MYLHLGAEMLEVAYHHVLLGVLRWGIGRA